MFTKFLKSTLVVVFGAGLLVLSYPGIVSADTADMAQLLESGRSEEPGQVLDQRLEKSLADAADAAYMRGMVAAMLFDYQTALKYYELAVRYQPHNKKYQEELERIKKDMKK